MASTRDYLELHFIVLLWGFTAILGALITIPPVELVFYRTVLSAALLGIVLIARGTSFRLGLQTIIAIVLTGILIGAHWITFFLSARVSNVSVSLVGFATIALWTSLLEPIILRKKFRWYQVMLGFLTLFGLYVIFQFEFQFAWGLTLGIISAFLGSLFTVLNGKWTHDYDHYAITFYEMIGALASIALFFPWYSYKVQGLQLVPTSIDWIYLLILALVCTVYAYSVSVELMKRISAFAINLTVNLEPVYGIIMAVIIFGDKERMTSGFYLGTGIILLAVLAHPLLNKMIPSISDGNLNTEHRTPNKE
ncbi:MAG: permease [Cyclobacteriaceae bacterium]|nr:MAG: permease [Cyclobacteriaceae bacterium]